MLHYISVINQMTVFCNLYFEQNLRYCRRLCMVVISVHIISVCIRYLHVNYQHFLITLTGNVIILCKFNVIFISHKLIPFF